MINTIRYATQTLVLIVGVTITLILGFSFIPLWSILGPLSLIGVVLGVGVAYMTMGLVEAIDEWADPIIG
jgi:hypothetical protein